MKYFLGFLIVLLAVSGIIYIVPSLHAKAWNYLSYSACDTPLQYSLGSIDNRFGLTQDQVLQDISEATDIWSSAWGKSLFSYSPGAPLTINFVYDERQALNSSINQLNSQLSQNNKSLSTQIAEYKADVSAFQQKLQALNAEIDKYNSQGGAPPDVYKNLTAQQQELNKEADSLNARAKELNLATVNYNNNVSVLNNDVNQFNSDLAQKPEEGLYDGQNSTITIYLENSRPELIHTLTHEFGHALGMDHVKDPQAIMYPYTTSALSVTAADTAELNFVCRKQSLIVHDIEQFDLWVFTQIQTMKASLPK